MKKACLRQSQALEAYRLQDVGFPRVLRYEDDDYGDNGYNDHDDAAVDRRGRLPTAGSRFPSCPLDNTC